MSKILKQLKASTGKKKLICFPFAGGYSTAFRPIAQTFTADWDMIAIEPPGHGGNRAPLLSDMDAMVDLYLQELLPILNTRFALFGHSMGGHITYKIAQRLEAQGLYPETVIISGVNPPDIPRVQTSHMDDQEFLEYVISLGGMPEEVARNQELLEIFMPPMRADFLAVESFRQDSTALIQSPVHVLSGEQDERYTPEKAKGWSKFVRQAEFHSFGGGHMFILSHAKEVSALVSRILNEKVLI